MRTLNFAKRNFKELIRDPLSLVFEIALPLFLLFIFQQFDIQSDNYNLENFTPSIMIFGFSFISLFTATLVAKDRTSSFLIRLGTSPMKSKDYILGYILSIIPIILIQMNLFYITAILLGLKFSLMIIPTMAVALVVSIFFIALGILIGSAVSEKGTGGLGSIIVQLVCFTSGMYFPKEMIGGFFAILCKILPFEGCLKLVQCTMHNDSSSLELIHVIVFGVYFIGTLLLAIYVFKKKMISDNK